VLAKALTTAPTRFQAGLIAFRLPRQLRPASCRTRHLRPGADL